MLTTVRAVGVALATVGMVAAGAQAFADSGRPTNCDPTVSQCTIIAVDPGKPASDPTTGSSTSGGSGRLIANPTPTPEPTMVNGSCTYTPDPSYQPPPTDTADQHTGEKGAWYQMTCPDAVKPGNRPIATTTTTEVWLPTPPPAPVLPTPAQLAAEAQKKLQLPAPTIASNPRPGLPQLVSVPMWAWTPRSVFTPVSATAEVPGESVTATATPVSVTWIFGDGSSTTCAGPGTPFPAGGDPEASSPDCGHTYTRSSGSGSFTVTATITWNVTWAGAGQVGSFNGMTTTASEQVQVLQSQAVVTGG